MPARLPECMIQSFQSTPPVKAATVSAHKIAGYAHISIHAAREGGDHVGALRGCISLISIHAAREGGDMLKSQIKDAKRDFNPRRP